MNPLVSAVIPTRNRPRLVCRAVRSALNQTYTNLELIVVVDGPDQFTVESLEALHEPRLRIVALRENVGGCEARNTGVREARGEWIAFLDDDDEWLPEKISRQIALLANVNSGTNFINCRYEVRGVDYNSIMPHRFPKTGENWSEYIYCQHQDLLPSTYLVKRNLMLDVPFTKGLVSNEDSDWLLRVRAKNRVMPEWLDETLMIYHCESSECLSKGNNWQVPYQWALAHRDTLLTRKAFSYCLLWLCLPRIKKGRNRIHNLLLVLYKAIIMGRIDLRFLALFVYIALSMGEKRHMLKRFYLYMRNKSTCRFQRNTI
jgi:glycosyltransferase involved in cell wall biosynthesis